MVNALKTTKMNKSLLVIGAVVVLSILPIFFHADSYVMNVLMLCLIWGVVAASWDLILGYASVFSFGHLSFFTIGGYTSGLLGVYLGIPPWIGMLIGGIAAAFIGVLVGIPCLRLEGMYLAIVTFSIQFVLPTIIVMTGPGMIESFNSGGTFGLQRIPPPVLFGYTFTKSELVPWYYLSLVFFLVFVYAIYRIIRSPVGLAFMALRDAEPLAKNLGIDEYRYKLLVFGISSFIAGVMGAYYAHYFGLISPAVLSLELFLTILVMVLFGGMGVFPGAIVGAFVINFVNEALRVTLAWRLVALGAIVILVMTLMPKGLMGIPELLGQAYRRLFRIRAVNREGAK
jgi:branched-chain amino acid transport system permease protein